MRNLPDWQLVNCKRRGTSRLAALPAAPRWRAATLAPCREHSHAHNKMYFSKFKNVFVLCSKFLAPISQKRQEQLLAASFTWTSQPPHIPFPIKINLSKLQFVFVHVTNRFVQLFKMHFLKLLLSDTTTTPCPCLGLSVSRRGVPKLEDTAQSVNWVKDTRYCAVAQSGTNKLESYLHLFENAF